MNYSNIATEVNDRLNNRYYSGENSQELFRAINRALRDINNGNIGNQSNRRRVGYDFQRESSNLSYIDGTERYTLSTYITDTNAFKWLEDVLINSDENRKFTKRTANYFRRKRGVNNSQERMFAEEYLNGTKSVLIYHGETDTLNLIWYSNYMVLNGTTRQEYFSNDADLNQQELLMPEEFSDAVIDLATSYLYLRDRNEQTRSSVDYLSSGRQVLISMINSIGRYEKKPADSFNMNTGWGIYDGGK